SAETVKASASGPSISQGLTVHNHLQARRAPFIRGNHSPRCPCSASVARVRRSAVVMSHSARNSPVRPKTRNGAQTYGGGMETVIDLESVSKIYPNVRALDEVTLQVAQGEAVAVVG